MSTILALMQKSGFRSYGELARSLQKEAPEANRLKPRSMETKLGQLAKNTTGWWLKRPVLVEHLAAVLGCTPADLGLHASQANTYIYGFKDFPELSPLDLSRERPYRLGEWRAEKPEAENALSAWFDAPGVTLFKRAIERGVSWLHFPPGSDRDLFWEDLKQRSPYECIKAGSISAAADRLREPKPVCLYIDESKPSDLRTLALRDQDCAVLICAPFAFQKSQTSESSNNLFISPLSAPRTPKEAELKLTDPESFADFGGLTNYHWHLFPDWRYRLIEWIDHRLGRSDSLFDSEQLMAWLKSHTSGQLLDDPSELMAICRFAHLRGVRKLPRLDTRHAANAFLDVFSDADSDVRTAFRQVVQSWITETALPWSEALSPLNWRALSQETARSQDWQIWLNEIAGEADETKRRQLAEAIRQPVVPSEHTTASLLRDSEFTHQDHRGFVSLRPALVARLLAQDRLVELIRAQGHSQWGHLYFDDSRRTLVDQALALLTLDELVSAARQVLADDGLSAGAVGAAEAIYCAVGYRDLTGEPLVSELIEIGRRVLNRLTVYWDPEVQMSPQPWSGAASDDAAWLAICWTWSLVAPPLIDVPLVWRAHFPGWTDELEDWESVGDLSTDRAWLDEMSTSTHLLLERVDALLDAVPWPTANPPPYLMPALIRRTIDGGRPVSNDWWIATLKRNWASELLRAQLDRSTTDTTTWLVSVAIAIHSALSASRSTTDSNEHLMLFLTLMGESIFRDRLFEIADPKSFCQRLANVEPNCLAEWFQYLPEHYQIEALRVWNARPEIRPKWGAIRSALTPEMVRWLTPWLTDDLLGAIVGSHAWYQSVDQAANLLRSDCTPKVARSLVQGASADNSGVPFALKRLEQEPDLLTRSELRKWTIALLPSSAKLAPRLLALLPD